MYRHGELLIKASRVKGKKLKHLILAEGEVTSHKHAITKGKAELYEHEGTLFLKCLSECELSHPDHKTIVLPKGEYEVTPQREYIVGDEKYRRVSD